MVSIMHCEAFAGISSAHCLNLAEIKELGERERLLLEDTTKNIESVIVKARNYALEYGLELELIQKGLITTLIVTTASFVLLYDKSRQMDPLNFFAVIRCMAEALGNDPASASRAQDQKVRDFKPS